ncbi:MAG: SNF2-related protein, partial [Terracoccus sp.]
MSPNVRRRTSGRPGGRAALTRPDDPAPIIPVLARRVREIEAKVGRGPMSPSNRTKFQVIALLVRSERARIKGDAEIPSGARTELLKRLDGIATILAQVASRDTSLLTLLDGKTPGPAAQRLRLDWLVESGAELAPEDMVITAPAPPAPVIPAGVTTTQAPVPPSVSSRVMSNPFLAPDLERALQHERLPGRLAGWDLMDPLYRAFEEGAGGGAASMDLPPAPTIDRISPEGSTLMVHQARFLEEVRLGHRTFLLADEPGLGKTAQSVLAASVAGAYPMLAVVPNVVKINWAREVQRWTPHRRVAVIHGDGRDVDAFADVFVVNYEILDRHFAWLSSLGLRSMVVDEAHFIKNLKSQRSQQVLA